MGNKETRLISGEIAIRSAAADDADMLVEWHRDPEIRRYWDDEIYTREEMLQYLAGDDFDPYIIEERDQGIGYIQAWYDHSNNSCGLDMFLIPSARGRGIGPQAARLLASHVQGAYLVTVDPYIWNTAAIRAWEKAGFHRVGELPADDDHPHPWLLMEFGES